MPMSDYELLTRIREQWPVFIKGLGPQNETVTGASRTVTLGRDETPLSDPIAYHDGVLTVAARREYDESLIDRDLQSAGKERIETAFGGGVITHFQVVARDQVARIVADELVELGLQVQRLLSQARHARG